MKNQELMLQQNSMDKCQIIILTNYNNQMQKQFMYTSLIATIFKFRQFFNVDHNNPKNQEGEMSKFLLMLIQCLL